MSSNRHTILEQLRYNAMMVNHSHQTKKDDVYAGAPPSVVALGRGHIAGWIGSATGFTIGVIGAALSPDQFGETITKAAHSVENFILRIKTKVLGKARADHTNLTLIVGVGFIGSVIGHYIGLAKGVKNGLEEAQDGPQQFERIKAERNGAQNELSGLKGQIDALQETTLETANTESKHSTSHLPRGENHVTAFEMDQEKATEHTR